MDNAELGAHLSAELGVFRPLRFDQIGQLRDHEFQFVIGHHVPPGGIVAHSGAGVDCDRKRGWGRHRSLNIFISRNSAISTARESLSEADIDALPFGVVRLSDDGGIQVFSDGEARLSGYGRRVALGLNFFTDVAPCFATDAFLGRIQRARAVGKIDIEFGIVGDFGDAEQELRVRVQSASAGGIWIFTQRL